MLSYRINKENTESQLPFSAEASAQPHCQFIAGSRAANPLRYLQNGYHSVSEVKNGEWAISILVIAKMFCIIGVRLLHYTDIFPFSGNPGFVVKWQDSYKPVAHISYCLMYP